MYKIHNTVLKYIKQTLVAYILFIVLILVRLSILGVFILIQVHHFVYCHLLVIMSPIK